MAQVYKRLGRHPIQKGIALHKDVQADLRKRAVQGGRRAERILARHRHDGHAEILVERGRVDHYVTLSDERGMAAAAAIEYGWSQGEMRDEEGNVTRPGTSAEGLFILHRAMRIKPRAGVGRSRVRAVR